MRALLVIYQVIYQGLHSEAIADVSLQWGTLRLRVKQWKREKHWETFSGSEVAGLSLGN